METDIPLRTLMQACAPDLLSLFGESDAEVVDVLSLEMPTFAKRLDNLLLLRDSTGNISLHLVEWQGYRDPLFLWRVLLYLGWLGLHRIERPITVTLVYLQRADDMGDTLYQEVARVRSWGATFHCIRLWEMDAQDAVRTGRPGLAVLSPLMQGATETLVKEAGRVVLTAEQDPQRQADLLGVLGVFAELLLTPNQFVHMFEKERLMESKLLELLMHDKLELLEQEHARKRAELEQDRARERAELEQDRARERAELEQEWAQRQAREQAVLEEERTREQVAREEERTRERIVLAGTLTHAIEAVIAGRFPTAPITLIMSIRRIPDPQRLSNLLDVTVQAPDLATIERAIAAAVE